MRRFNCEPPQTCCDPPQTGCGPPQTGCGPSQAAAGRRISRVPPQAGCGPSQAAAGRRISRVPRVLATGTAIAAGDCTGGRNARVHGCRTATIRSTRHYSRCLKTQPTPALYTVASPSVPTPNVTCALPCPSLPFSRWVTSRPTALRP